MNLQKMLVETIGGMAIYAVFKASVIAVDTGKATETQKRLVNDFREVLSEYKTQALLEKMKAEADDIAKRTEKFEKTYGMKPNERILKGVKKDVKGQKGQRK